MSNTVWIPRHVQALASIAAISRVELKTKTADTELGSYILIESSIIKTQEPVSQNQGTSVAVKNLFFNVPARRNFLKSDPVEMRHIIDEFQRVALSNPNVAFMLHQNDKEIYNLSAGKLSQRIVGIFGKNHQKQLITCQEETHWIKITGYIGKPEFARKTRGEQFFFVNKRFIKSSYLNHAVNGAFQGMIKEDQYPFYALFIEMDPSHTDINVHPTKTEVKFDDERSVYGVVKSAVRHALGTHHVTPSLDYNTDVNFESMAIPSHDARITTQTDRNYGNFKTLDDKTSKSVNWEQLYESALDESIVSQKIIEKEENTGFDQSFIIESSANDLSDQTQNLFKNETSGVPFLMHEKYLFKQVKSGVMIMDVQLAYERILYEKYTEMLQKGSGSSQRCLFPVTIEMNPADFSLVIELSEEIQSIGFDFEEFGKNSIVINGIPADLQQVNEKELFEGLIDQFKFNKSELSIDSRENMARSFSKRSAGKTKISNDSIELRTLIDRLFACSQPNYTPNGTPTFIIFGLEKIEDFFNR